MNIVENSKPRDYIYNSVLFFLTTWHNQKYLNTNKTSAKNLTISLFSCILQKTITSQSTLFFQGVAFPLLFKLFLKFGNSNNRERIELVERYPSVRYRSTGLFDRRSGVCRWRMDQLLKWYVLLPPHNLIRMNGSIIIFELQN